MNLDLAYDWLPKVKPEIFALSQEALLGPGPAFPWEELTKKLKELFSWEDLKIQPQELSWKDQSQLLESMGESPSFLTFSGSPLEGTFSWGMSQKDLHQLFRWFIAWNGPEGADVIQEEFLSGLYTYLSLEVLQFISPLPLFQGVSLQLTEDKTPTTTSLCFDVGIFHEGKSLQGRLYLSKEFHTAWKKHQISLHQPHHFSEIAPKIDLSVEVGIATLSLTLHELNEILVGSFVILDSGSFDPARKEGAVVLSIHSTPIFSADLKKNQIKLTDHPVHFEEPIDMNKPPADLSNSGHDDNFEEDDSFDFDDDEEDPFLEDEEFQEALAAELPHDEEDEFPEEEEPSQIEDKPSRPSEPVEVNKTFSPSDIPLTVTVEIARLQLSIQKILSLKAGNQLSLEKEVSNQVVLLINGKKIAEGELMQVGDILGVRITQI